MAEIPYRRRDVRLHCTHSVVYLDDVGGGPALWNACVTPQEAHLHPVKEGIRPTNPIKISPSDATARNPCGFIQSASTRVLGLISATQSLAEVHSVE